MTTLPAGPYCRVAYHGNYRDSNPDHRCFMAIGLITVSHEIWPEKSVVQPRVQIAAMDYYEEISEDALRQVAREKGG